MRFFNPALATAALFVAFTASVLSACAADDPQVIDDPTPTPNKAPESAPTTTPAATPPATPPAPPVDAGMCTSHCAADSDCQNTCPTVASGSSNCCDLQTNTCYSLSMGMCPAPVDPGNPAPTY